MSWLNNIVDKVGERYPAGEILIESGGSPSGKYHIGHLRELVTADAVLLELKRRGRTVKHIYFSDDLDALRKVPVNVPTDYEKYLGLSLCDIPAPDGSNQSYADLFLQDLIDASKNLGIDVEFIRSYQKYRAGFFAKAIERSLERLKESKRALEDVSGRKLGEEWSPIQVNESGYLKKRPFVAIDTNTKTLTYLDKESKKQVTAYDKGQVKLDWRLDWPARWWLLKVQVEPFGQDHASKGGSFDTGEQLMKDVYEAPAPLPIPYDFINMVGDTKKMSASKGTGLDAVQGSKILPPEVMRYFVLRYDPRKRLYFDPIDGVVQLMDEFAAFSAKPDKTVSEEQLLYVSTHGQPRQTVSRVPFSHLVASYQSSLKDVDKTLEVIKRTEHSQVASEDADIIKNELKFIDAWLEDQAPEDIKFDLLKDVKVSDFNDQEQGFLKALGEVISTGPEDADGEWFHKAIYDLKEDSGLEPKQMFSVLYRAIIGKTSGPRAGWFLSILPRDWLVKRLMLGT